jgi:hypothetical protein
MNRDSAILSLLRPLLRRRGVEHEIPAFMVEHLLAKGAGHKYIRRVPKPGGGYRYYYTVGGGAGLGHHSEIGVGAAFRMKDAGKEGHFHVTHDHGDGHVTVKHDESGTEHKVHKDVLSQMLKDEHAEALAAHAKTAKDKALATLREAHESGSEKHIARAKAEAVKRGASEDETLSPAEKEQRRKAAEESARKRAAHTEPKAATPPAEPEQKPKPKKP